MKRYFRYIVFCLCLWASLPLAAEGIGSFPVPEGLELRVQFWVNVYSRYTLDQRVIHDRDKPERIYTVVNLRDHYPTGRLSQKRVAAVVGPEKRRIAAQLKRLASGGADEVRMTPELKRLAALFGPDATPSDYKKAAARVHVQRGARESFAEGLMRSGQYIEAMRRIFMQRGLPEDLVYLAHVESSFNPHARSSAGAVGLWQFTRQGGARYFSMGAHVDQRRDPLMATAAAARELAMLRGHLGSWPLAVTAYNVGRYGVERAARRTGSKELSTIIDQHRHRNFGFASKNFYCSFLAAVQVAEDAQRYFPALTMAPGLRFRTQQVLQPKRLDELARLLDVNATVLADLNPALSKAVRRSERSVPQGYGLHVPIASVEAPSSESRFEPVRRALTTVSQAFERWTAAHGEAVSVPLSAARDSLPAEAAWPHWTPERYHVDQAQNRITVHPGETLGHLAQWLDLPASVLRRRNGLRRRQRIRAGQRLHLDFSRVSPASFETARIAYHHHVWRAFFDDKTIESWREEVIRQGESIWALARRNPEVPFWLLWAANGQAHRKTIKPGQAVQVPVLRQMAANQTSF